MSQTKTTVYRLVNNPASSVDLGFHRFTNLEKKFPLIYLPSNDEVIGDGQEYFKSLKG